MTTMPANSVASKLSAMRGWLIALPCALSLLLAMPWLASLGGISLPAWFSAAGGLACLFAMLVIAWRAGALRGGFLLAFAAALLLLPAARYLQLI